MRIGSFTLYIILEGNGQMLRIILAAIAGGIGFGIMVTTVTGNLTIEGMAMGLTSIGLVIALSGIAYLYDKKHETSTSHSWDL
jgi:hypothetical protein